MVYMNVYITEMWSCRPVRARVYPFPNKVYGLSVSVWNKMADLLNNQFWVRKSIAAFNRIDLNKDGVLSADDIKVYQERAIQYANMNEQQTELSARRNAELIAAWFGSDDKHLTLEQYLYVTAMSAAGTCTCRCMHAYTCTPVTLKVYTCTYWWA